MAPAAPPDEATGKTENGKPRRKPNPRKDDKRDGPGTRKDRDSQRPRTRRQPASKTPFLRRTETLPRKLDSCLTGTGETSFNPPSLTPNSAASEASPLQCSVGQAGGIGGGDQVNAPGLKRGLTALDVLE